MRHTAKLTQIDHFKLRSTNFDLLLYTTPEKLKLSRRICTATGTRPNDLRALNPRSPFFHRLTSSRRAQKRLPAQSTRVHRSRVTIPVFRCSCPSVFHLGLFPSFVFGSLLRPLNLVLPFNPPTKAEEGGTSCSFSLCPSRW